MEGLRQLPSFVDNAKTENDSAAPETQEEATTEQVITTGSYIPTAETESALPVATYSADPLDSGPPRTANLSETRRPNSRSLASKKQSRKITGFAAEDKGYVSTSSSEKQANGKLSGQVVVKVLPDNLDKFLLKLRGIGELKNQALTTEDVTKAYFDTESRLKNARLMEQRLIEILKTKSKDVADLLEVEKETRPGARGNRDDAGRTQVHGFPGVSSPR